eukprot:g56653.t1
MGGGCVKDKSYPPTAGPLDQRKARKLFNYMWVRFHQHAKQVRGKVDARGSHEKLEYAKVALSTVEEEKRFLPYKKPRRGDKLAKITMQDMVGKGAWAVATIEGNDLFCYELAANADPRWQQKNVKLGELPVHIVEVLPGCQSFNCARKLAQTPLPCCSGQD